MDNSQQNFILGSSEIKQISLLLICFTFVPRMARIGRRGMDISKRKKMFRFLSTREELISEVGKCGFSLRILFLLRERLGSDCFGQIGAMVDGVRVLLEEVIPFTVVMKNDEFST